MKIIIYFSIVYCTICNSANSQNNIKPNCEILSSNISSPIDLITSYKIEYDKFLSNNNSDFQIFYMVKPNSEALGYVLYVDRYNENYIRLISGNVQKKCERIELFESVKKYFDNIQNLEEGNFIHFCPNDGGQTFFCQYIIKIKDKIVFYYQGYNKNPINLNKTETIKIEKAINFLQQVYLLR